MKVFDVVQEGKPFSSRKTMRVHPKIAWKQLLAEIALVLELEVRLSIPNWTTLLLMTG